MLPCRSSVCTRQPDTSTWGFTAASSEYCKMHKQQHAGADSKMPQQPQGMKMSHFLADTLRRGRARGVAAAGGIAVSEPLRLLNTSLPTSEAAHAVLEHGWLKCPAHCHGAPSKRSSVCAGMPALRGLRLLRLAQATATASSSRTVLDAECRRVLLAPTIQPL